MLITGTTSFDVATWLAGWLIDVSEMMKCYLRHWLAKMRQNCAVTDVVLYSLVQMVIRRAPTCVGTYFRPWSRMNRNDPPSSSHPPVAVKVIRELPGVQSEEDLSRTYSVWRSRPRSQI